MKTMPEIVSEMTAIARKELRTKIQRSRAERKGPLLLGKIRSAEGASSSGGKNITATISKNNMLWQANFGTFRGMGGVPGGMLEITAKNFSETAGQATLCLTITDGKSSGETHWLQLYGQPNTMVKVVSGTSKHHYLIGGDGNSIFGAGVSTRYNHLRPGSIRKFGRNLPHRI